VHRQGGVQSALLPRWHAQFVETRRVGPTQGSSGPKVLGHGAIDERNRCTVQTTYRSERPRQPGTCRGGGPPDWREPPGVRARSTRRFGTRLSETPSTVPPGLQARSALPAEATTPVMRPPALRPHPEAPRTSEAAAQHQCAAGRLGCCAPRRVSRRARPAYRTSPSPAH
jgi:hypothetical protein